MEFARLAKTPRDASWTDEDRVRVEWYFERVVCCSCGHDLGEVREYPLGAPGGWWFRKLRGWRPDDQGRLYLGPRARRRLDRGQRLDYAPMAQPRYEPTLRRPHQRNFDLPMPVTIICTCGVEQLADLTHLNPTKHV
jgi:hypothetical protein